METVLVDNERLAMELPDGFHLIARNELEALMGIEYDYMWGARDEDRHMLLVVTWKDSNKLFSKLAGEKALAKRVDEANAKRFRKSGYHSGDLFERTISGASASACGFRFSNTVQGVSQEGEVLVFKNGIRCYTLWYYTRTQLAVDNRPVYEAVIESIEAQ